jgi:hypothetical protein
MGDVEGKIAGQAQDALRQLKLDVNDTTALDTLRETHRVVQEALLKNVSSDVALKSVRSEIVVGLPALIKRLQEGAALDEQINYMLRVLEDLKTRQEMGSGQT